MPTSRGGRMSALRENAADLILGQGFQLEGLIVDPATGDVAGPAGREKLDPKVMQVLVLLARHAGQVVPREDLVSRLWPDTVVTDDALTRCIYELRRQLSQAGGSERYRAILETLPKRGYRLNGEVLAPPPPASDQRRPAPAHGRRLAVILGIAVVVGALIVAGVRVARSPPADSLPSHAAAPLPSIAVLSFADMSATQDQAYLADGVAEEILNLLAKIPELRVISRNSAFAYKGRNVELAEIAAKLKVSHVLEGSVRKSGDRIRITTQLVDARSDTHLWSEQYDRKLDDLFEVQDDIARQVVVQLKLKLLEAVPKARRVNPQAHLSYVQARHLLEQSSDGATIDTLLRQALDLDPTYAQAWTGYHWLYFMCQNVNATEEAERVPAEQRDRFCARLDAQEAERLGIEALDRALALDPQNATAIAYRAIAAPDFDSAGKGFEQAAKLDPTNPDVLRPIMFYTQVIRRSDLTVRIGEFVVERDPDCAACLDQLARGYENEGRLAEAATTLRTGNQLPHILARILVQQGDPQAALDIVQQPGFIESENDRAWALHLESMALYSLGRTEESMAALATLESRFGAQYAHLISPTYAWCGDMANAVRWLERHFEAPYGPDAGQLPNPLLKPVLRDPRIHALLRQHGLAPEQLAQIKFEVTLPGGR